MGSDMNGKKFFLSCVGSDEPCDSQNNTVYISYSGITSIKWSKHTVNIKIFKIYYRERYFAFNSNQIYPTHILWIHLSHHDRHFRKQFWQPSFVSIFMKCDQKIQWICCQTPLTERQTQKTVPECLYLPYSADLAVWLTSGSSPKSKRLRSKCFESIWDIKVASYNM